MAVRGSSVFGTAQPPGYFGKLPARADFVAQGLGHEAVECWDSWLQHALAASQAAIGEAWRDAFFEAPLWRFILPHGACGRHALIGVLMPSVDAVGRCFPLMLGHELAERFDPVALLAGSARWFEAAEALALETLRDEATPAVLEQLLPALGGAAMGVSVAGGSGPGSGGGFAVRSAGGHATEYRRGQPIGQWRPLTLLSAAPALLEALLAPGSSPGGPSGAPLGGGEVGWPGIWWSAGAPRVAPGLALTAGLVPERGFAALLDGNWARHGWNTGEAGGLVEGGGGDLDWDRDA